MEFEHADVDSLAGSCPLTGDQCGKNAIDDVEPGGQVGDPDRPPARVDPGRVRRG